MFGISDEKNLGKRSIYETRNVFGKSLKKGRIVGVISIGGIKIK